MKTKILPFLLLVLSTTTLFGDADSVSEASFYDSLKKSPVKFELMSHHMTMRNSDKEIAGSDNLIDAITTYKMTPKDSLKLDVGFQHLNIPGDKYMPDFKETYFNTLELNYRRAWVKEGEWSPSVVSENRINYVPSASFRDYDNTHGNTHHRLTLSKNFGNFNLTNQYRFQVNERISGKRNHVQNYTRIYLTPSYYFSQNFGANLTTYWAEEIMSDQPKKGRGFRTNSFVRVAPGLDFYTNNFMIEIYASYKVAKSHDDRVIREDFKSDPILGLILAASVF
ncbi:MAG: hypothetical protein U0T83_07900 [Bacteriovoracaceae bacterium]